MTEDQKKFIEDTTLKTSPLLHPIKKPQPSIQKENWEDELYQQLYDGGGFERLKAFISKVITDHDRALIQRLAERIDDVSGELDFLLGEQSAFEEAISMLKEQD